MLPESQSSSSTVNPQTSNIHEHNPPNNLPSNPPEENEHNPPQQKIPNSGEDSHPHMKRHLMPAVWTVMPLTWCPTNMGQSF